MRRWLTDYASGELNATADNPFKDAGDVTVLRRVSNRKWFGLIMAMPGYRFDRPDLETVDILNLKCDPNLIGALRQQPGFYPAYHMNKERWITVRLDGTVDREQILTLLHMSYDLTSGSGKSNRKQSDSKRKDEDRE